ncbi:MAG: AAA family ATPase [Chloroflexi bacterium]|nr:AAA family ATPase [Chloroflexota bacterium]
MNRFPFNTPILQTLDRIEFTHPVTFLVGENGSGKSTLLEAIACAVGSITVGAESVQTDPTLASIREAAKHIKLAWTKRTRRGFFMRSEDFFGFAKRMGQIREELQDDLRRVEDEYKDRSEFTKGQARMAYTRELHEIEQSYGEGLDINSHGESYFKLFQARFVPDGLYLLDEPEAPLSPMRQLAFLSMLHGMIAQKAQFIIATHSPIIMAYPDAQILSFDNGKITQVAYDDLEHVTITRSFLMNPQQYLKHLLR